MYVGNRSSEIPNCTYCERVYYTADKYYSNPESKNCRLPENQSIPTKRIEYNIVLAVSCPVLRVVHSISEQGIFKVSRPFNMIQFFSEQYLR